MTTTIRKAVMLDSPRRAVTKSIPTPRRAITAQEIADETAARLRTAAERNRRLGPVREDQPSLSQFTGDRVRVDPEFMGRRGRRQGLDTYSGDARLDEKAARISKVARDPHASPADRMDANAWFRKFNENNRKVAAITAAGRFLAGA